MQYFIFLCVQGLTLTYVKFIDRSGNTSEPVRGTIYYDKDQVYTGVTPTRTLQKDEIWDQDCTIYGQVIVPAGIHLTICAGVTVTVDGPTNSDPYQNGLIVEGNLTIQNRVTFVTPKCGWQGILITGTAEIDGVNISLAKRGLAIGNNADVTVNNSIFIQNFTGIHIYESNPEISYCTFRENIYGIKEDKVCHPIVNGNVFIENSIHYYSDSLTRITIEQLNLIPGNGSNH